MLSKKLKLLRKEFNLSQTEFALKLNLSKGAVGMYETDKREPDFDTLIRIADYFGVTLDYLLGRTEERTTDKTPKFTVISNKTDFELSKEEKALILTLRRSNNAKAYIRAMITMLGETKSVDEILSK